MGKIIFVVNPVAGGGRAKGLIPKIKEQMHSRTTDYEIVISQKPKDAIEIAKDALNKGYENLVAVGGDGTVNEVALSILESGRGILGIIPSGTGNDLARSLKIPFDPEQALNTIWAGQYKKIDVGMVNGRPFLNIASIGFDSAVVKNTEKIKKRVKSKLAYIIGILVTLIGFKDIKVKLQTDDQTIDENLLLVAVGNGKYYGGGLKVLPMAIVEDGYFHICIVKKMPKLQFLLLLPTIIKGNHVRLTKYVQIYKTKKAQIDIYDRAYLNMDGEIKDAGGRILFTIVAKKLPVFVNQPS